MSAYKFKGWENIDGSSVTREETDSAFKVVMHSAQEIEAAYQVRQKAVKRAKVMRIMMYAAAALILIASPLAWLLANRLAINAKEKLSEI